jgi:hypothetical protein
VKKSGEGVWVPTVKGEAEAVRIAAVLIHESRWFELEPRPYDKYMFNVRPDAEGRLRQLILGEE